MVIKFNPKRNPNDYPIVLLENVIYFIMEN